MLHPIITHTPGPHLPFNNRILDRAPTLQSLLLASIRTMQQIQIQITQPALLDTLLDGFPRLFVAAVFLELGGEPDVLPLQLLVIFEMFEDRGPDFVLVGVPFCGVDCAVAG